MKQYLLIVILVVIAQLELFAQGPMLPINFLPMILGEGGPQKGGLPLMLRSPNILVDENKKSGRRDTINVGSTVKLWLKPKDSKGHPEQESNKNAFHMKAQLLSITDSTLVLMKGKGPGLMLPLPPPFSLIPLLAMKLMPVAKEQLHKRNLEKNSLFAKSKAKSIKLDTIRINDIVRFRAEDMVTEGGLKSLTMMPAMSFMPKSFTTWPTTLYAMPATMFGSEMLVNAAFSTRSVNSDESTHRILVEKAPLTKSLYTSKATTKYETEWGYEKVDRWNRLKGRLYDQLFENAISEYRGNRIMGLSLSYMIFPSYVIGPDDKKTRVNIPDKKFMFGFSMENFISDKIRVGMEMQTCQLSQPKGNFSSQNMSVGMGLIFSNFTCIKINIGNGFYTENYKEKIRIQIEELKKDVGLDIDNNITTRINLLRSKLLAEPKPYYMFGGGATNTTLMKIYGNSGSMSMKEYTQKKFSLTAGAGLFMRMGWRLTYDLSCRYVYSPDYSPAIGGLYSYSGFKFQLNIGYMSGQSFSKMKKLYKQASKELLGTGERPNF